MQHRKLAALHPIPDKARPPLIQAAICANVLTTDGCQSPGSSGSEGIAVHEQRRSHDERDVPVAEEEEQEVVPKPDSSSSAFLTVAGGRPMRRKRRPRSASETPGGSVGPSSASRAATPATTVAAVAGTSRPDDEALRPLGACSPAGVRLPAPWLARALARTGTPSRTWTTAPSTVRGAVAARLALMRQAQTPRTIRAAPPSASRPAPAWRLPATMASARPVTRARLAVALVGYPSAARGSDPPFRSCRPPGPGQSQTGAPPVPAGQSGPTPIALAATRHHSGQAAGWMTAIRRAGRRT